MKKSDIDKIIDGVENRLMEESLSDALNYAQSVVLVSAADFLDGIDDWNDDELVEEMCELSEFDYEFVWLATRVLFGPAVVYVKTGKVV
jgi:hypothetical protein